MTQPRARHISGISKRTNWQIKTVQYVEKAGAEWAVICDTHDSFTTRTTLYEAGIAMAQPWDWCDDCKSRLELNNER